ncbi:deacetylase [Myxococcaceae bacterium GXIMD 01537]
MPRKQPIRPHFRRVSQRLGEAELSAADSAELTADDLRLDSAGERVALAFGTYSRQGLQNALNAFGLGEFARDRGLAPVEVRLLLEDPFQPRIVIWSQRFHAPVVDISLRRVPGAEVGLTRGLADVPVLYLDAFTLQHPGRPFDWSRPPMPGQARPGLSLSSECLELLLLMARRIGAEAMALSPATFAAAWVYERHFSFVDGAAHGRYLALRRAGHQRPRWLLAWAVELGCVKDTQGEPVLFHPSPMVSACTRRVERVFESRAWSEAVKAQARVPLSIDYEALQARFPWQRMPPGSPPERVAELLGYDPLAPA